MKRAVRPPLRVPAERASAELHLRPPSPWRQLLPAAAAQGNPELLRREYKAREVEKKMEDNSLSNHNKR